MSLHKIAYYMLVEYCEYLDIDLNLVVGCLKTLFAIDSLDGQETIFLFSMTWILLILLEALFCAFRNVVIYYIVS